MSNESEQSPDTKHIFIRDVFCTLFGRPLIVINNFLGPHTGRLAAVVMNLRAFIKIDYRVQPNRLLPEHKLVTKKQRPDLTARALRHAKPAHPIRGIRCNGVRCPVAPLALWQCTSLFLECSQKNFAVNKLWAILLIPGPMARGLTRQPTQHCFHRHRVCETNLQHVEKMTRLAVFAGSS